MHLTKYIHSCLLLEQDGEQLLFDPGKFSFIDGQVSPEQFRAVSTVVITHTDPDHLSVEALQRVLALSGATVLGNAEVATRLKKEQIDITVVDEGIYQRGAFTLRALPAAHQPILTESLPHNTAFLVNNRVLNPGDSFQPILHQFAGVELLILPVMAPWLTELAVMDFARDMRPKQVIPVHDGYAKAFFLDQRYETYEPYFDKLGITFHALKEPGASVTL